jgi:cysteinyl-tRNA synthetase
MCLLAHYRKPLDFSLEALDSARNAYERLVSTYLRMRSDKTKLSSNEKVSLKYDSQFKEAVNNDLNLPAALGIVWNVIADGSLSHRQRVSLINRFDSVLGFGLEGITEETVSREVLELVNERAAARATKNWKRSDQLREKIQQLGYDIEDTSQGQNFKRR